MAVSLSEVEGTRLACFASIEEPSVSSQEEGPTFVHSPLDEKGVELFPAWGDGLG